MLELKKVSKIYETDNFKQKALDNVSISFRENEFVSILGPSGSGKTTLLNIIGGLDNYTNGDLIINDISTKKYTDRDWDTYRNHKIGFVFQSYNLIPHQSILANVELALTLSGINKNEARKKAKKALVNVGLEHHIHKRPNQLSGGQMQRVAIARALVNDPDILLADEPTGALDSKTSAQIMDLLSDVAKDRLVIMVTHNPELAEKYSTRIINLRDGQIKGDTNPYKEVSKEGNKVSKTKKTNMSFKTALLLSLNNLMTKKGRTLLTAFAGSIGIIGIALILSLSNGVQEYIDRVQEETLTSYPITIESSYIDMGAMMSESMSETETEKRDKDKIYSDDIMADTLSLMSSKVESNNLKDFKKYLESNDEIKDVTSAISYNYGLSLQLYKADTSQGIVKVNPNTVFDSIGMPMMNSNMSMMMTDVFSEMLDNVELNNQLYEVVSGKMPEAYNEMVIVVNEDNEINDYVLYALGIKDQKELKDMYNKLLSGEEVVTNPTSYNYDEIVGLTFKLLLHSDYYEKVDNAWVDRSKNEDYLKNKLKDAMEVKIVGILKPNEDATIASSLGGGVLYSSELETHVLKKANESQIIKDQQKNSGKNILTGMPFGTGEFNMDSLTPAQKKYLASLPSEELAEVINSYKEQASLTYDQVLLNLGYVDLESPASINIYAKDFEAKDRIKELINEYNADQEKQGKESNVINYNDLVGMLMSSVTGIVDIISYVLIGFVSISLVVSSIMIGIITYISVLERTKEIGILRAIGASKKDVSRVFNAETLIVGLGAGVLGIVVTLGLNILMNIVIASLAGVKHLSRLPFGGAIILIAISVILTMIAGLIPARMASKKDPVEALRSE